VFFAEGVNVIRLPFRAPTANSYVERWVGTARREVLDHLLIFGPRQLERVLWEFIDHYHTARLVPRSRPADAIGRRRCGANLIQPESSGSIASVVLFTSTFGQHGARLIDRG